MKKIAAAATLALALAAPAVAPAKPSKQERKSAKTECKAERKAMGKEAFRAKYGTNKKGRNAFRKCVSQTAREEEKENNAAAKNAAKECKAEREAIGEDAFAVKYGTNKNKKNAYGKCVSGKADENEEEADAEDREELSAARTCRKERETMGDDAFAAKHGTNENKKNAFGKCVSAQAQEDDSGESA